MQIPDAIYLLMQHVHLVTCDLSNNVISKLPVKFAERFSTITGKYKNDVMMVGSEKPNLTMHYRINNEVERKSPLTALILP